MEKMGARRWWALIAVAASMLVVGLDLTVLNLALPSIGTALHASTSDLQWFNDAYSLVLAAAVLPAGLLGDRYGRKRVLMTALAIFGVSSAACSYATTSGQLIAARAVLGLGAAAIMPLALAIIPVLFVPEERQKATAVMASTIFLSFPIGPLVGGSLLDHFWWGSVFLINVPVVVAALIAVAVLMPESRSAQRPGIDVAGVLISSAGLAGLTYGFIRAGQDGWGNAGAIAAIAAGAVALAAFVVWEHLLTRRAARGRHGPGLARDRAAADRAGAVPVRRVQLGHHPGHAGVVRDVRHHVRDAAVLPGGPRDRRLRQRAADAAADRRHAGGHDRRDPPAEPAPERRGPARRAARRGQVHGRYRVHGDGGRARAGRLHERHQRHGFRSAWFALTGLGLGSPCRPR